MCIRYLDVSNILLCYIKFNNTEINNKSDQWIENNYFCVQTNSLNLSVNHQSLVYAMAVLKIDPLIPVYFAQPQIS